jgi:SSS family solute:Na+ symporter
MVAGVLVSLATALIALRFKNLMDYIQLLFSLFNAPLLAIFLLGMFTRWATPWGGFWGLLIGISVGMGHNMAARAHLITYGSQMSANFYGAIYAWSVTVAAISVISIFTRGKDRLQLEGLVCEIRSIHCATRATRSVLAVALLLALACTALNVWFR